MKKNNDLEAHQRVRGLREFLNITRKDFSKLFEIRESRIENVEKGNAKVYQEDLELIANVLPEFLHYLVYGGDIDYKQLKKNKSLAAKILVARIEDNELPIGYGFSKSIINAPK